MNADEQLAAAIASFEAGHLADAERQCESLLQFPPVSAMAWQIAGLIALQQGQLDIAIARLHECARLAPENPEAHNTLGVAYQLQGEHGAALPRFQQAVRLAPTYIAAQTNLGRSLQALGRFAEAERTLRTVLTLQPADPASHHALALMRASQNDFSGAIAACRAALAIMPDFALAHNTLGTALQRLGQPREAIASFRAAVAAAPDFLEAWKNLGLALQEIGERLEAAAALRAALRLDLTQSPLHCQLGDVLAAGGNLAEAEQEFRSALALDPNNLAARNNLGNLLQQKGDYASAIECYRAATEAHPTATGVLVNLARAWHEQGCLDEAIATYRQAIVQAPDLAVAHTGLLLALHYHPQTSAADLAAEHRSWAARHAAPLYGTIQAHRNSRQPDRRLRIGYVSPDLCHHPIARFLLPLLQQHDRRHFEIFAYSATLRPDEMTQRLRSHTDVWRDIALLNDEAATELIRRDQIDILVDLTAHTAGTRLLVFARKPAPVQVTYLSYCSTTGLETIDYRLSDPYLDPPETDLRNYTEKTVRLPETYWCYSAPELLVEPAPNANPSVMTFGCLNNFAKVTDAAVAVWARVLRAVPASRLLLFAPAGIPRDRVNRVFQAKEVDPARVDFVGRQDYRSYLATFDRIHIALDPFPFTGGTTTCDALWMGVPVVTRAGQTAVSRGGASLLSNTGLPDLIARTDDRYVEIATSLARDRTRLTDLRTTLRPRLQSSPLMNAPRFTRNVEHAFRAMWRTWCDGTQT
jgi:protein O-GlcNAc transferase